MARFQRTNFHCVRESMKCAVLFVALSASVQAAEVSHGKHGRRVEQMIKVIHTFFLPNSLSKGGRLMIFVAKFSVAPPAMTLDRIRRMTSGYDLVIARNASLFRALYDLEFPLSHHVSFDCSALDKACVLV